MTHLGKCFVAKNNPGVWESPTATNWFWEEISCNGAPAILPPSQAPVTAEPAPVVTPAPTQAPDAGNTTWNANSIYTSGDQVVVNGVTYEAQWWTQGKNPAESGQWGVWKKL
ncbi:hypothetical protein D1Z90_12600 [Motilimonas pumila]|uniref:Chitin-binding type-3 domain-containing protein n=1 Tax=Motilimonas pumila TaxID=2303987 RepID=A0A418YDL8_9GAMM|nr:carbohydrate-binding protein [Motilimonas pumila]RJG42577.1 hypothetical protein D1Z90_12600 [Motilimonas pumila]